MGGPAHMSRVLVVGDVIDDVLVRPLGPTAVASDTRAQIESQPGGSAANVAAWAGNAGAAVTFVGRAGTDDVRRHADALAAHAVDAHIVADPDRRTGAIVLLVDPAGERTMYVDRGANASLTAADVDEQAWAQASWLHLTGYSFFCDATRPAAQSLLTKAVARGVRVCIDPSSAGFLAQCSDAFGAWIDGAEVLMPNQHEAQVLTGQDDPVAAGRSLLAYVPEVVVTCGERGAVRLARGQAPVWQQAPRVAVVDTTGAGDAFCAGLLAARVQGADLARQLQAGAELAARCVTRLGARPA